MLYELKQELIQYGKLLGVKNLTPGISGNISVRSGDDVIITVSGSANGYLEQDDLVVIELSGEKKQGEGKPSSEKFLHLEYYKKRPEIGAVIHVHSPYLTAFAACGLDLSEAISPEIVYCFGKIPLAEYALPGSDELVQKTSIYFKDCDIILMENHGVIVCGTSLKDAYLKLELAEGYAKTVICAKQLGKIKSLSVQDVKKIYELRQS